MSSSFDRGAEACHSQDLKPDARSRAISNEFTSAGSQRTRFSGQTALGRWQLSFGSRLSSPSHLSPNTSGCISVLEGPWKRLSISPLLPGRPLERPSPAQGRGCGALTVTHSQLGQPPSPQEPKKKAFFKRKGFQAHGHFEQVSKTISYPQMLQVSPVARDSVHGHRAGSWDQGNYFGACMALTRFWGTPGNLACQWAEPGPHLGIVLPCGLA